MIRSVLVGSCVVQDTSLNSIVEIGYLFCSEILTGDFLVLYVIMDHRKCRVLAIRIDINRYVVVNSVEAVIWPVRCMQVFDEIHTTALEMFEKKAEADLLLVHVVTPIIDDYVEWFADIGYCASQIVAIGLVCLEAGETRCIESRKVVNINCEQLCLSKVFRPNLKGRARADADFHKSYWLMP